MKSIDKSVLLAVVHAMLLLAVFALMPKEAMAVRTVGVNVGDSADYGIVSSGNASFIGLEGFVTAKITVTAISGTNVTSEIQGTYSNSSQVTDTGIVDVETGAGNATLLFTAANLNATDPIYTGGLFSGTLINETITRTYLGSSAQVNHFNSSFAIDIPFLFNISMRLDFYWFRSSGVMAESVVEFSNTTSTSYESESLHAIIASIVPEFPPVLILPLFMILSLVAVVLLSIRATPLARRHRFCSSVAA